MSHGNLNICEKTNTSQQIEIEPYKKDQRILSETLLDIISNHESGKEVREALQALQKPKKTISEEEFARISEFKDKDISKLANMFAILPVEINNRIAEYLVQITGVYGNNIRYIRPTEEVLGDFGMRYGILGLPLLFREEKVAEGISSFMFLRKDLACVCVPELERRKKREEYEKYRKRIEAEAKELVGITINGETIKEGDDDLVEIIEQCESFIQNRALKEGYLYFLPGHIDKKQVVQNTLDFIARSRQTYGFPKHEEEWISPNPAALGKVIRAGKGVCVHYTALAVLLLARQGITAFPKAGEKHAYLGICIEGKEYHVEPQTGSLIRIRSGRSSDGAFFTISNAYFNGPEHNNEIYKDKGFIPIYPILKD